jgi:hypothetical protein
MIPEADMWRAAMLMVKRCDADATLEAAARADQQVVVANQRDSILDR